MTSADHADTRSLRVLFITQWFEPEPAFKGARFARALADTGHQVRIVTGFPNYPGGKVYPGYRIRWRKREMINGLEVDRLALWPNHDRSTLGRIANYLSFFVSLFFYCLQHMRRFDVAYVYHPPLTPGLAAALVGKVSGTPFVLDVQDLWPDSVAVSGMANRHIVRLIDAMCRFVYARAAIIIGQSKGIANLIAQRGVPRAKLRHVYNWSNYTPAWPEVQNSGGAPLPPAVAASFEGHFNVVYGGNLGQAQALECLASATIEARRTDPRIRLHLFGDGISRDELAEYAENSNGGVLLHGSVPREVMDRVFERADTLALHLKDDPLFRHTIPSKLQHYMSVGRPILAGIEGEGRTLLEACGAAQIFAPMDVAGARDAMLALVRLGEKEKARMQQSSKTYYSQTLSFDAAVAETLGIIEHAARRTV